MAHERKTGRVMAIKGFVQLSGIPHSEYYLLNILSEKVLTSQIRKRGFKNELFSTLEKVVDRLCDTINTRSTTVIKSITGRDWIMSICSS